VAGERVTHPTAMATLPVIRALLDEAGRKDYRSGVLGVRPVLCGRPSAGSLMAARWCGWWRASPRWWCGRPSQCGTRAGGWSYSSTGRTTTWAPEFAHLVGNRLRTPDPWEAVRQWFAATGLDPALKSSPVHREIAIGLLAAALADGWPPTPAGALTRDHAFGTETRPHLSLTDPVADLTSVFVLDGRSRPGRADR
jgi:hypothetical protein